MAKVDDYSDPAWPPGTVKLQALLHNETKDVAEIILLPRPTDNPNGNKVPESDLIMAPQTNMNLPRPIELAKMAEKTQLLPRLFLRYDGLRLCQRYIADLGSIG